MHTSRLRKVGGSVMLAVPPALLDVLELRTGETVGMTIDGCRLIIEPQPTPTYTLAELLAESEAHAAPDRDDPEWLAGAAVGDELI